MGTRSDIIVQRGDGKWARVYCHWNGYLEGNGRILFDHYTSQAQAEELVSHGDMSSLGAECSKPAGHSFQSPVDGHTVYYGRDRGETGTDPIIGDSLQAVWPAEGTWSEFTYVWCDGRWLVGDPDTGTQCLVDLGEALMGKATITPAVKAFGGVIGQHQPSEPAKDHGWIRFDN